MVHGLVRGTGIEPVHPCGYKILSLGRLPIPPPALEAKMLPDPVRSGFISASWHVFLRHFLCWWV